MCSVLLLLHTFTGFAAASAQCCHGRL